MEQRENAGSKSETSALCPVTGLPILTRPDWTNVSFGGDYRVTFSVLGNRILLQRPSGYATLNDIEHLITLLDKNVLPNAFPQGQPYVRIENWAELTGFSRQARECYISHIKAVSYTHLTLPTN